MKDTGLVHEACVWCYRGVWGILTKYFKLPEEPPRLPVMEGETIEYIHPSPEYLAYQKFFFWIGLFVVDVILTGLWILFAVWWPLGGLLITPLALALIVLPDIVAYIALHLRYDTTWYALSDRSMRLRRGVWSIHETTITFENIQNIDFQQGPVQRAFGFANLVVKTAGGGGGGPEGAAMLGAHIGILEGLSNAQEVRNQILAHCKKSGTTGLGDEEPTRESKAEPRITPEWIEVLRDIRDVSRRM